MQFLLLVAGTWTALATSLAACEIKWPDPDVQVPPLVQSYIVSECRSYKGYSEENVHDCIVGERYGYRSVVAMLEDPQRGPEYAERYRSCAVGLGDLGGRFHRRKAECMATVYRYVWRFEFTRQASLEHPEIDFDPLGPGHGQIQIARYHQHAHEQHKAPPHEATVIAQN